MGNLWDENESSPTHLVKFFKNSVLYFNSSVKVRRLGRLLLKKE